MGDVDVKTEPNAVDEAALVERLKFILPSVDLASTTEKMIRKRLEEEFGADLTEKKAVIRAEIQAYLDSQAVEEEGEEEAVEEKTSGKRKSGGGFPCVLSPAMSKFLGTESMPRTQVVKALWEYIRKNNLQDPANKRNIRIDEQLGALFKPPLNMFSLNKQLSRHCLSAKNVVSAQRSPSRSPSPPAKKGRAAPKAKAEPPAKKATKKAAKSDDGTKKLNGFTIPVRVSGPLADLCGCTSLSRPEITKRLTAYFKEQGLQDPQNRRYVLSDDKLKQLTGEDRFLAFGVQKYLGKFIEKM